MNKSVFLLLLASALHKESSLLPRGYYYVSDHKNWLEAQSYCREKYTDLATVDNMEDLKRLLAAINLSYSGSVYIGLKRGNTRRWVWSSGQSISQYSNWASGEPNGHIMQGLCAANLRNQWIDDLCDNAMVFVCYSDYTKTFTFVSQLLNWKDARSHCQQKYTDLAVIHNKNEQQIISSLTGSNYAWIGLYLDTWEWSDQTETFFREWKSGLPSTSPIGADCATIVTSWQGLWNSTYCYEELPFVCYKTGVSRHIVQLQMTANDKNVLNNPAVRMIIVTEIKDKLSKEGMTNVTNIKWREKNGEVFQIIKN